MRIQVTYAAYSVCHTNAVGGFFVFLGWITGMQCTYR